MPVARISYTHWSAPMAGFRYSFQGMFGRPINERYYGAATGGFDWMTDLTAVSYGCDNSRVLSLRSVLGFNLGADHSEYTRLNSDLHAGGQLALRLSSHVNLLGEAQLGYEFTSRYKGFRSHRVCSPRCSWVWSTTCCAAPVTRTSTRLHPAEITSS